jgi:hypothetical protein
VNEGKVDHDPLTWPGVIYWLPLIFCFGLFMGALYAIARGGFLDIITGHVTAGWLLGLALFALEFAVVVTTLWVLLSLSVSFRARRDEAREEERTKQDSKRHHH